MKAEKNTITIFEIIIAESPPWTQKFIISNNKNGKTDMKDSGRILFLKLPVEIYETIKDVKRQIAIPAYFTTFKSISHLRIITVKMQLNTATERIVVTAIFSMKLIIRLFAFVLLILGIIKSPLKLYIQGGNFLEQNQSFLIL